MRMHHIAVCLAAASILPIAASAQTSCENAQRNRVAGTVAGAGIGAVVGSNVAGHGAKSEGGVLGAIVGGVIGNQVAKANTPDCARAYGYYDNQGAWHANAVVRGSAAGYFDRDGVWVSGEPNGYYDAGGRWVTASQPGYYDRDGRWVPPSVTGYYDPNDRWIAISAGAAPPPPVVDERIDIRTREDRLRDRIERAQDHGDLNRHDARRFLDRLHDISVRESSLPRYRGALDPNDEARVQAQLDALNSDVRAEMRG